MATKLQRLLPSIFLIILGIVLLLLITVAIFDIRQYEHDSVSEKLLYSAAAITSVILLLSIILFTNIYRRKKSYEKLMYMVHTYLYCAVLGLLIVTMIDISENINEAGIAMGTVVASIGILGIYILVFFIWPLTQTSKQRKKK